MTEAHYPIQSADRLTGLSPHVIRIWEQGYHAVASGRPAGKYWSALGPLIMATYLLVAQGASAAGTPLENIHVRDPFILPVQQEHSYYMIASSGHSITARQSEDLKSWGEPEKVFEVPEGFWGGEAIWAPEIHPYRGRYYLFATFMNKEAVGSDAPWAPRNRDRYITDGPALYRSNSGKLFMLWSSFSDTGYTTGIAVSDRGKVVGPWRQQAAPFFREDGGHAMIFRRFDGTLMVALHSPNRGPEERCRLLEVEDTGETLRWSSPLPATSVQIEPSSRKGNHE
jgi:hypothetical protein